MFSRLCGKAEMAHRGKIKGSFFNDIMGYTIESVILAMASLDAFINEFISTPDEYLPGLNDETKDRFAYLTESNLSSLEIYEKALSIIQNGALFDKKQYPYHDTVILRNFKNALIHFYPEWQADDNAYEELGETLSSLKFKLSPFYEEDRPFFPFRYMSYGCSRWAVNAAYDFMEMFSNRIGMPFHLSTIKHMFDTDIPYTS